MKFNKFYTFATVIILVGIAAMYFIACQKETSFDLKSWSSQNNLHYLKSKTFTTNRTSKNTELCAFIPTADGEHISENKFFVLSDCPINIPKEQEVEIAYDNFNFFFKIEQKLYLVSADSTEQFSHKLGHEKLAIYNTGFSIINCSDDLTINKLFPSTSNTNDGRAIAQPRMVGCDFLSGYESCGGGSSGSGCTAGGEGSQSCSITAGTPCTSCNASTVCGPNYFACCRITSIPTVYTRYDGVLVRGIEYSALATCLRR